MELAEEWTRAGHFVEKFCLTDAFPKATSSSVVSTLRTALFPRRAAAFVRQNAARFDVIDCLIGTLPFPKKRSISAGFWWRGQLVFTGSITSFSSKQPSAGRKSRTDG
jgi:hypothetical protein